MNISNIKFCPEKEKRLIEEMRRLLDGYEKRSEEGIRYLSYITEDYPRCDREFMFDHAYHLLCKVAQKNEILMPDRGKLLILFRATPGRVENLHQNFFSEFGSRPCPIDNPNPERPLKTSRR